MLDKIIHPFLKKRHPWRNIEFNELAEIYTSMSMRSFGFGIIGIFVPIYLYGKGVSIDGVLWYYFWVFLLRIPLSIVMAYVVGRIGPKHGIAVSTLLFVVFLSALLSFEVFSWPLIFLAFLFTLSNGLFFISYHTDFSKIKDTNHGGKELGWLYIFERIGGALGPLVGGVIATMFSPDIAIMFAIIVLAVSLVPLFLTNEPVRLHQRIRFKGFPWRRHLRDFISMSAAGIENAASQTIWPLFVAVVVFSDNAYLKLGGIIALSLIISLFSARMFGAFIDKQKGGVLFEYGVVLNCFVHMLRPFSLTGASVTAVSTLNEPVTLSYRMPLMKGYYDAADSEEGYRIVYLAVMESIVAFFRMVLFFCMWLAVFWVDDRNVLRWSFLIVAILSLGMLVQKFPALKKP